MKQILAISLIAMLLFSCSKSREEIANELIKDYMQKSLVDPRSYEPIETIVDSAFLPLDNPKLFENIESLAEIGNKISMSERMMNHAESSISIFSGRYQSDISRTMRKQAEADYNKAKNEYEYYADEMMEKTEVFFDLVSIPQKHVGYKATHRFRSKNNAGQVDITTGFYLFDEKMEKILYACEKKDYDEMIQGVEYLKKKVEQAKSNKEIIPD